jgi:PAS domain S-box-containing protein
VPNPAWKSYFSPDPPAGLGRQALRRWIAIRHWSSVAVAVLLVSATAWILTLRALDAMEEDRRHRLADLAATAAAALATPEFTPSLAAGVLDPRLRAEVRMHLTSLRQANRDSRSIFLLMRGSGPDGWAVLVESAGDGNGERASGTHYESPPTVLPAEALRVPVVSTTTWDRREGQAPRETDFGHSSAPTITVLAPIRGSNGATVALFGADINAAPLLATQDGIRREGALVAVALGLGIVGIGFARFRRRRADLERSRAQQAQISIYRVGETLARADRDDDLIRFALDAIATGSGIEHWVMYLREPPEANLSFFASRGLPAEARPELEPDPIARNARSPASRAAWHREALVARDAASAPDYAFPDLTSGLGARPIIVSVPLLEAGEVVAVLQCFVPRERSVEPEELALIRWMGSQVSVGLKRIRMERRDQMLASYMMSTGEILFGLAPDATITHANTAAGAALGMGVEDLVGRPLGDWCPDLPAETRFDREFAGELWFLREDGRRFPAEVRISPTSGREGGVTGAVLVGHDATERHAREAEIANRTEELALINEELQRANEELTEARRRQNEFVANTSHELRTPLNAVIGFAALIEQRGHQSEEEAAEFAGQIRRSAEHLLNLLNDILDLAKVEAGRFQLSMSPGDLRDPIRAAVDSISPIAQTRGLKLLVELPMEPVEALLDGARVRQVMLNLLGNAVKFTDRGEVRVRAWRDPETGEAIATVQDSGVGIPKEMQDRLFSKFTQVDGSYTRRHQGTGLGLAISKALIQNMGGTISLTSEGLGKGTLATVTLRAPPTERRGGSWTSEFSSSKTIR